MGSLKYEISQRCKQLQANPVDGKHTSLKSWRTYMDSAIHFGQWCKTTYGCRHFGDCQEHIPDYVDWLAQQGKSASTIHTYLAGVCRVFEVPLADVKKPKRVTSQNTRSRGKRLWTSAGMRGEKHHHDCTTSPVRWEYGGPSIPGSGGMTLCTTSLDTHVSE